MDVSNKSLALAYKISFQKNSSLFKQVKSLPIRREWVSVRNLLHFKNGTHHIFGKNKIQLNVIKKFVTDRWCCLLTQEIKLLDFMGLENNLLEASMILQMREKVKPSQTVIFSFQKTYSTYYVSLLGNSWTAIAELWLKYRVWEKNLKPSHSKLRVRHDLRKWKTKSWFEKLVFIYWYS